MAKALIFSSLVLLVACTRGASLRTRSAGDLNCPAESLKIYHLDDRSYRVMGCGQQVVYISTCNGPIDATGNFSNRDCTWVMNTVASRTPASSQPAASAAASGCSFDAQCKGDRICVDKRCVAPQGAPIEE